MRMRVEIRGVLAGDDQRRGVLNHLQNGAEHLWREAHHGQRRVFQLPKLVTNACKRFICSLVKLGEFKNEMFLLSARTETYRKVEP